MHVSCACMQLIAGILMGMTRVFSCVCTRASIERTDAGRVCGKNIPSFSSSPAQYAHRLCCTRLTHSHSLSLCLAYTCVNNAHPSPPSGRTRAYRFICMYISVYISVSARDRMGEVNRLKGAIEFQPNLLREIDNVRWRSHSHTHTGSHSSARTR